MRAHLDVDLADMLRGTMSLVAGAQAIAATVGEVINGTATAAERLDYLETNISRIGPSV
jgi:altronate dehydratase